ncbi:hypothetical protein GN244_ATG02829 [Phytophthora infestans]|uniref:Uncharacterized protein n=1 Tax=Phytophthora infestans TaxID=4787 RepID=A0A833T0M5_PHYIN|nr:hypothetical protein GN244_ATG02829 [Phytophthora infestans]
MACGQVEANAASFLCRVTNKWESRRLDEVHYSFNAHVILISLGCMRTCGFKLVFKEDQSTTWLCKDGLMLRFDCYDILYRMRVKRSLRLVGAAVNRVNAMGCCTASCQHEMN